MIGQLATILTSDWSSLVMAACTRTQQQAAGDKTWHGNEVRIIECKHAEFEIVKMNEDTADHSCTFYNCIFYTSSQICNEQCTYLSTLS